MTCTTGYIDGFVLSLVQNLLVVVVVRGIVDPDNPGILVVSFRVKGTESRSRNLLRQRLHDHRRALVELTGTRT